MEKTFEVHTEGREEFFDDAEAERRFELEEKVVALDEHIEVQKESVLDIALDLFEEKAREGFVLAGVVEMKEPDVDFF